MLRENKNFLAQTIRICFSCFYVLTGERKVGGEEKREEEVRKRKDQEGSRWEERSNKKEEGSRMKCKEDKNLEEGENIWEEKRGNKGEEFSRREEGIDPGNKYFLYKGYDDYFTINDGLVNEMGGWGGRKKLDGREGKSMREWFSLEDKGARQQNGQGSNRGSEIKEEGGLMNKGMEGRGSNRRKEERRERRMEDGKGSIMEKKSKSRKMEEGGGGKEEGIRRLICRKTEEEGGSTRCTEEGEDFWDMYQDAQRLEKHLKRKNEKCIDILREVRR